MKLSELKEGILLKYETWPQGQFIRVASFIHDNTYIVFIGFDERNEAHYARVSFHDFEESYEIATPEDEKPKNWLVDMGDMELENQYDIYESRSEKQLSAHKSIVKYLELPEKLEWKYPPKIVKETKRPKPIKKKAQVKK